LEGTAKSGRVAVEQFLDGFRLLLKMGSWRVLEIDSEDEVITCFLQRGFRDIQETNFFEELLRRNPSAILAGTDTADRRI
jgi:hypothetical protein